MIIFINGSINSGKSTVSKILSKRLLNIALIEIDALHEFIEWMPIQEAIPINLENTVSVIKNFSKRGIDTIVPYPLSQKNYEYLMENLHHLNERIEVFTLSPQLDRVLENRGERELSNEEKERIRYHYEIGINNPSFGVIIDNTNQSQEETADIIMNKI